MGLTVSTGIVSGINSGEVIQQLMALEQRPLGILLQKKASFEAKISAFGGIKSALSTFKTNTIALKEDTIFQMAPTSSDTSILTATAKSTAAVASHSIVVENLATAQSIHSEIFTTESSAVADLSVQAVQKLKIQVGSGVAKTVTIDSTNNTLKGIKDAINTAAAGVAASLVTVGFDIDSTNQRIDFEDDLVATRTATLTVGNYTGDELAAEIKARLEDAPGSSTDTYTVTYDSSTKKFTINNDATNTNALDLLFESTSLTTAEGILGFTTADHASVAVGSGITSDNGVDGVRLILTSSATGASNRIVVSVDEDNDGTFEEATSETDTTGLSKLAFNATYGAAGAPNGGTQNLTQSQAAIDAELKVNGLTLFRSSNTISDIITDVTLNLLSVATTTPKPTVTLSLAKDLTSITGNINGFIGSYNKVVGLARSLSVANSSGRTLLTGDSTARGIINTLRSAITATFKGKIPASLGLSHSKDGVLSLDTAILEKAIDNDLQGVLDTLDAMAVFLEATAKDYIDLLIPAKLDGLNNSVRITKDRIEGVELRLSIKQESLTKQFSLLEQTLSKLQSGEDFLSSQLDSISDAFKRFR